MLETWVMFVFLALIRWRKTKTVDSPIFNKFWISFFFQNFRKISEKCVIMQILVGLPTHVFIFINGHCLVSNLHVFNISKMIVDSDVGLWLCLQAISIEISFILTLIKTLSTFRLRYCLNTLPIAYNVFRQFHLMRLTI